MTTGERIIDETTGEVLSPAQQALRATGREAAEASRRADLARMDLAEMEEQAQAFLRAQFPHLASVRERVLTLAAEETEAVQRLRDAALVVYRKSGAKSALNGTVVIVEIRRVTRYDPSAALDWCDEMNRPDLTTRTVDKTKLEKLARNGDVPESVMKLEMVPETRFFPSKLITLLEK